ncbi:hypothetical protein CkaCkLH20_02208 [Colletotrichum karsti]|uniref:Uncharacterized protein n=1 Tax=Colletotrichum karsti TaxID=1095194 RepID=A0A9P6ID32_9PEZI|nr:uncharacterized protein CkaCkLH20_02208 [Colletotrichum karsti]KAF9880254.1 hypothetical protein CkaCkLH20_02208 [Colletotrichum karsti]
MFRSSLSLAISGRLIGSRSISAEAADEKNALSLTETNGISDGDWIDVAHVAPAEQSDALKPTTPETILVDDALTFDDAILAQDFETIESLDHETTD